MQRFLSIIAVWVVLIGHSLLGVPKAHSNNQTEIVAIVRAVASTSNWRVLTLERVASPRSERRAKRILVVVTQWPGQTRSDIELIGRSVRITGRWQRAKKPPIREDMSTLYEGLWYSQRALGLGDRPNEISFFVAYSIAFDTR